MSLTILRYPPPLRCPQCGRQSDVFAAPGGWSCFDCLRPEDRAGDPPSISPADRRAMLDIRRRLATRGERENPRTNFQPEPVSGRIGATTGNEGGNGDRASTGRTVGHPAGPRWRRSGPDWKAPDGPDLAQG